MPQKQFLELFKKSKYFLCVLALGLVALAFTFKTNIFSKRQPSSILQTYQLSSIAGAAKEIEQTEYRYLQGLSDSQITEKLKQNRNQWLLNRDDYAMPISSIQNVETRSQKKLPKRFQNNPAFMLLENFAEPEAQVKLENKKTCESNRLYYENIIFRYPELKNLLVERKPAANDFSQQCVAYSMNQYRALKTNYASCEVSTSPALLPGNKPCVTESLVNLTYNAVTDVASCLGLNPKNAMPQIDFESGYFLNSFGMNQDSGLGQLSKVDVVHVNKYFDQYMKEIEDKSIENKSCARLLDYKKYLTQVNFESDRRCMLMALPENPLLNILYTGLLERINQDQIEQQFTALNIKNKLEQLGLAQPDLNFFKEIISKLALSSGLPTTIQLFNTYLDLKLQHGLKLTLADFDFNDKTLSADLDGQKRTDVAIARSYVLSSYVEPQETGEALSIKIQKRKKFPLLWATAFRQSFPVYFTLKANSYNGNSLEAFSIYGFPGYLNLLTQHNQNIRQQFENSKLNPDNCTNRNYLKYDQSNRP